MRTLAITQNVTLDGRVEMLGDWFVPQAQGDADNGDLLEENRRQDAAADALLVGRRTFEDLRGYWRDLEGDTTGISEYLDGVRKHVVSATLDEPAWEGADVLRPSGADDLVIQVRRLKEADGQDVVCTGSITLCHALVAADLVDEYRLFTYPVVQGAGRRLFPDGYEASGLRLAEATAFRSGIGYQRWVRR
ncbi:dihydrofolate reductase family protein [Pseudokineococcus marinus]|uniref:Dihydrofolate reductase n=1 Tax=Pseudokineococcus marinus TaxID=351215 RepID=A0A849BQV5_9ACTN|nr:dihydrofolate reductase family protein [Pseudokineococcus marinus]NNH23377.1 dihydrofolate reductase [Pseudokineococcus marinus]